MSRPIRIAVASGKGGTGKTTVATNLAVALAETGRQVAYVDCDVEEPNGHIFLKPTIQRRREVSVPVPEVDETRCALCGACGEACRYSAIVALPEKVLTFPGLCNGCGGCTLACPEGAIREVPRAIGVVEHGVAGHVAFSQGKLNVGEASPTPVIRAVLESAPRDRIVVVDSPPGTSCPVIESVKTADVVLLVTEPTPFGLNDLKLAVEMVRELGVPFGVAVNRVGTGDNAVLEYCVSERIPVLIEIPNDREIARACSRGALALTAMPDLKPRLLGLYEKLGELAGTQQPEHAARLVAHSIEMPAADRLPSDLLKSGLTSDVRDLVVVSGKGGTGKTSIVASFFALAKSAAVADCDVDAADLHLLLDPNVRQRWPFSGGMTAQIDAGICSGCGACAEHCRFGAVRVLAERTPCIFEIDPISCEGCGVCVDVCRDGALSLVPAVNGEWFVSDTRFGPMVHARLGIAEENSGKLVSLVRREAKAVAQSNGRDLLICDGSPGIGCSVISSIAGASMALLVTEPTMSGRHDLGRVAVLCRQFDIRAGVCINKADINPAVAAEIEVDAARWGMPVLGLIRYDEAVTAAQVDQLAVVEKGDGPAAADIRALWERVLEQMEA
jgi:MinD superfamily P-loop ATPase